MVHRNLHMHKDHHMVPQLHMFDMEVEVYICELLLQYQQQDPLMLEDVLVRQDCANVLAIAYLHLFVPLAAYFQLGGFTRAVRQG
jgi:hypothetical protein